MSLTKEDYRNLQVLLTRVNYNGLDEAKAAVVLDAKLTKAIQEFDGNANCDSSNKPSPEQPAE
jgi:hypothetical protein